MADPGKQSSTGHRLLGTAILVGALVLPVSGTRAEIIIDDFTDDLRIDVPEQNTERILFDHIGDLNAFRSVTINGLRPIPIGFLEINRTHPSAATVEIPSLTEIPSDPILTVAFGYAFTSIPFDGVDLTQSGSNTAVFLEFDELTASVPLHGLRVSATHGPTSSHFSSRMRPMPQSFDPFTLVFPFDDFVLDRGGPTNEFVFTNAREFDVIIELARITPSLPEQLDFHMILSEIRVGQMVPEPPPTSLGLCLLITLLGFDRRSGFVFLVRCRKGGERGTFWLCRKPGRRQES